MTKKTSKYAYDRDHYENLYRSMAFDGSAARKLQTVEYEELEEELDEEIYYEEPKKAQPRREERRQESRKTKQAKQPRVRMEVQYNKLFMFVMTIAIAALLYNAYVMLHVKSEITQLDKQIGKATVQLADVNALNESLASGLDTEIDKNYIYNVAVGKLGMVYPNNNMTVYYDAVEGGYVRQFLSVY